MKAAPGKTLADFRAAHDPTFKVVEPETVFDRKLPAKATRFIITAAQNATPVHPEWWRVIQTAARSLGAEILVIPLRYKNPTSQWSGSQKNAEFWAPEVRPYLWNQRRALNKHLTLLADFKIQPTASSPLTGAEALSLASSGIIGHTKVHLRSVPTPSSRMAKLLTTTGACTVANYTDSRAGRIGEFHHSLSAVLVELDGARFFMRHLHYDAKNASCIDLDTEYFADGRVAPAARPLALVCGDTHVDSIDRGVHKATYGPGGLVALLNPLHIVHHDLLDAYSCNPHHEGNPFNAIAKLRGARGNVREEVERAIAFVRDNTPKGVQAIVVGSNHDDMLRRWIVRSDWRSDAENAQFYLETALAMVRNTRLGSGGTEYPNPFVHWLKEAKLPNVRALYGDESFSLGGVEMGMHGDIGPNGSRGSIKNLRRIGTRSIIGHCHSPGIDEGCYQTGTSTVLNLEYAKGPSSWLNSHCILYANGKRTLIHIIDGKFRP